MKPNANSTFMNPPTIPMTPPTDFAAVHAMRDELTQLLGGKAQMLGFMLKNKAAHMKDQFRIFGAELARRGASLTSSAPATAKPAAVPARQLIRLGAGTPAAAPSKPTTAPKPSTPSKVHEFVPVKPATPPAKSGTKSGALSIAEAEALALKIFPSCTTALNTTEAARWKSLEGVFAANGHSAPWRDDKRIGIPSDKLAGHAARAAKISRVFETGLTRSEFSKLSARDQSDFCKNGGQLRD